MSVKTRISLALHNAGKSQRDLAKHMGLTSASVSSMLSKEDIDSIKYLEATAELTGYSFEWLRTGHGSEIVTSLVTEPNSEYTAEVTIAQLEKLVRSQQGTIDLLNKRLKAVEDDVKKLLK